VQVAADFELVRMGLAVAMLLCASYFDLKKRSVSDLLWISFAAVAGILYIFDHPQTYEGAAVITVSMAIAAAVSYGIYRCGLFGGADMLALITLSAILPVYDFEPMLIGEGVTTSFHPFAPLVVLTNAVVFSVSQIFWNVLRNIAHKGRLFEGLQHEPASKKVLAMMIGHRSENPKYSFSIEKVVNGRREFDFALKPAETAEYETKKDVWVTTATPFLVFITAGIVIMALAGDVLALVISILL